MKILQICQSYPPMISGASIIVARLAEGFAHKGHDVMVIAASDQKESYVTKNGRLHVERLPSWPNPARAGQRFILWPRHKLYTLIQEFNPDIIHLHETLALGVCGLNAARKLNIPVVITLHQLPWFITKYMPTWWGAPINLEWFLWQYGKWFLTHCNASIVPMPQIATVVKRQTGHKPQIIPYTIDLQPFKAKNNNNDETSRLRRKYGLSANKPIILHTGRLDPDKGVNYVISAAAKVMAQIDVELLIVGDGCQREKLIEQCKKLGIDRNCHFPGFISLDGDLPALYKIANLFVTASEIETFGIVILEAIAAARPIVAAKATCIPELVQNQHNGFLISPKDIDGFAEKMLWLLRHPGQAKNMGQKGQEISQKYNNQETMLWAHLQLYQSIQESQQRKQTFLKTNTTYRDGELEGSQ